MTKKQKTAKKTPKEHDYWLVQITLAGAGSVLLLYLVARLVHPTL